MTIIHCWQFLLALLLVVVRPMSSSTVAVTTFSALQSAILGSKVSTITVSGEISCPSQIVLPSNSRITLIGSSTTAKLSSTGSNRLFVVHTNSTLFVKSMTLTSAQSPAPGVVSSQLGGLILSNGTVDLSQVTLSQSIAACGSAIFSQNGTVLLTNVTVTRNTAQSTSCGGAIYVAGGVFNSTYSSFSSNTAYTAGAVYLTSATIAHILHSQFMDNTATGTVAGALYATTSSVSVRDVRFNFNLAATSGGAMFLDNLLHTMSIADSQFTGNNATTSDGGSIYATNARVSVTGSVFSASYADNGGGALVVAGGSVSLSQSQFNHNMAGVSGGAVNCRSSGALSLSQVQFLGNVATSFGGALNLASQCRLTADQSSFTASFVPLTDTAISAGGDIGCAYASLDVRQTTFSASFAGQGSAIYAFSCALSVRLSHFSNLTTEDSTVYALDGSAVSLNSSVFANNSASSFSSGVSCVRTVSCQLFNVSFISGLAFELGTFYAESSVADVDRCLFRDNVATGAGAGVFAKASTVSLRQSVFLHNRARTYGGALTSEIASVFFVEDCYFANNSATDGGAVYGFSNSQFFFLNTSFHANVAADSGGALYLEDGSQANVSRSHFHHNFAPFGGAVYLAYNAEVYFSEVQAYDNSAGYAGGVAGVFNQGRFSAVQCQFVNNSAALGGAVAGLYRAAISLQNCTLSDNSAFAFGGALYLVVESQANVSQCVFTANVGSFGGGVLQLELASATVRRCTFAQNLGAYGAVAQLLGSKFYTIDSEYANNGAKDVYEGGVFALSSGSLVSSLRCDYARNQAQQGGLAVLKLSSFESVGDTWSACVAAVSGCVLATQSSSLWLTDTVVSQTQMSVGALGGVISVANGNFSARNATFRDNYVQTQGALTLLSSEVRIADSLFQRNVAVAAAGVAAGLFFGCATPCLTSSAASSASSLRATVNHTVFVNNEAKLGYGGALSADGFPGRVSVTYSVFQGNKATNGGAIAAQNTWVNISSCSFVDNSALEGGGGVFWISSSSSSSTSDKRTVVDGATCVSVNNHAAYGHFVATNLVALFVQPSNANGLISPSLSSLSSSLDNSSIDNSDSDSDSDGDNNSDSDGDNSWNTLSNSHSHSHNSHSSRNSRSSRRKSLATTTSSQNRAIAATAAAAGTGSIHHPHNNRVTDKNTWLAKSSSSSFGSSVSFSSSAGQQPPQQVSGQPLSQAILVSLHDAYGQTVTNSSSLLSLAETTVYVSVFNNSGLLRGSSIVAPLNGTAHFSQIVLVGKPGASLVLQFSVSTSTVADVFLTVDLRSCVSGEITLPVAGTPFFVCEPCPAGTYSFDPADTSCSVCPAHASCPGRDNLVVSAGYWRTDDASADILACPQPLACRGGANASSQCHLGQQGPYCSVCAQGFAPTSTGLCYSCASTDRLTTELVSTLLFGLLLVLIVVALKRSKQILKWYTRVSQRVWQNRRMRTLRVKGKILIAFAQIVFQLGPAFNVVFPVNFLTYLKVYSFFSLNLAFLPDVNCLVRINFYGDLLLSTIAPVALYVLIALGLQATVVHARRLNERNPYYTAQRATSDTIAALFVISYFVLISVSSKIFEVFQCETFDNGESFLVADYSISCQDPLYTWYQVYGVAMIFVYPVGIPLAYAYILVRHRHRINPDWRQVVDAREKAVVSYRVVQREKIKVRKTYDEIRNLSMLFDSYLPRRWYFELFDCVRRLLLGAIPVLILRGSSLQIVIVLLVSLASVGVFMVTNPYIHKHDNQLAILAQWSITLVVIASLIIKIQALEGDGTKSGLGIVLILLNIFVVFFSIASTVINSRAKDDDEDDEGKKKSEDSDEEEEGEEEDDEVGQDGQSRRRRKRRGGEDDEDDEDGSDDDDDDEDEEEEDEDEQEDDNEGKEGEEEGNEEENRAKKLKEVKKKKQQKKKKKPVMGVAYNNYKKNRNNNNNADASDNDSDNDQENSDSEEKKRNNNSTNNNTNTNTTNNNKGRKIFLLDSMSALYTSSSSSSTAKNSNNTSNNHDKTKDNKVADNSTKKSTDNKNTKKQKQRAKRADKDSDDSDALSSIEGNSDDYDSLESDPDDDDDTNKKKNKKQKNSEKENDDDYDRKHHSNRSSRNKGFFFAQRNPLHLGANNRPVSAVRNFTTNNNNQNNNNSNNNSKNNGSSSISSDINGEEGINMQTFTTTNHNNNSGTTSSGHSANISATTAMRNHRVDIDSDDET